MELAVTQTPPLSELGHVPILTLRLEDVQPSPENDRLYRPVDASDPQIIQLAESLRDCGIQEPLLVTRDRWIISGHRRYAAARLAGLSETLKRYEKQVAVDAENAALRIG